MSQQRVKIGVVQRRCSESLEANLGAAESGVREAAGRGAQIICLQELFRSAYFCQVEDHKYFDLSEPVPGPTTEKLQALAKELYVVIVASLFERRTAGIYHNTAAIIDAGGTYLGKYRKMHIPDDPLYYEKFYFTPGDLGFHGLGHEICADRRLRLLGSMVSGSGSTYGVARARRFSFTLRLLAGIPAREPNHGARQHSAWETIQRGHAVANGCYVAVPNRTGHEAPEGSEGIEFWGQSFICDPSGEIVAKASVDKDEVIVAEADLNTVETQRTHWPFLRDRRIDAYGEITRRFID